MFNKTFWQSLAVATLTGGLAMAVPMLTEFKTHAIDSREALFAFLAGAASGLLTFLLKSPLSPKVEQPSNDKPE